ncbi:MAG: hypothetical protein IJP86_02965 [Synergistaceae bacterium]|nr:hypothetical protein [Synergistaceae bacterium]
MMKRIFIAAAKILLFMAGFVLALYMFIPWREAGKFAVSAAQSILQQRGMRLNYSDVSRAEGGFTVDNLTLSGMVEISLGSVTVRPAFLSSILSLAPVCDITFRGGSVRLGQTMNFGDGGFLLTAGREVLLENLRTNGDFSLNGYMTIDTSAMRIGHAEARLDVPETFSQNMGVLRNLLPLVQEGDRWYLRRK